MNFNGLTYAGRRKTTVVRPAMTLDDAIAGVGETVRYTSTLSDSFATDRQGVIRSVDPDKALPVLVQWKSYRDTLMNVRLKTTQRSRHRVSHLEFVLPAEDSR